MNRGSWLTLLMCSCIFYSECSTKFNRQDFLTGFIADITKSEVYGRPVGIAILADGSMLVADDVSNIIWKVSNK